MSLNSSAAQLTITPQQQDSGLPAALPPNTPDVANPSEPEQTEPVLANRSATNSSAELANELDQPPKPIAEHSAPEKSDRSTSASSAGLPASKDDVLTMLKEAALSGDAEAQFKLGVRYDAGEDVEMNKDIAFEWFQKAAELSYAKAQFYVGVMYGDGKGVKADKEKSFLWIHKAAEQGVVVAQYFVGVMYGDGKGVKADKEKAFLWIHKAAEKNYRAAQKLLSAFYQSGVGVTKD